ncbi:MAG TPA: hypothetical protein VF126_13195 [Acidobacteriaceae bacterium]
MKARATEPPENLGTDQQTIFNSLKDQPPNVWLDYIRQCEAGKQTPGLSFDLIIHYAVPRAEKEASLDWAEVAIRAAELASVAWTDGLREAMRIRAQFISKMGSCPGRFVLDKEVVLRWILNGLRRPRQEVVQEAAAVSKQLAIAKTLSSEDKHRLLGRLRELRTMKQRLSIAKTIIDSGEVLEPSLDEWLTIRAQLP